MESGVYYSCLVDLNSIGLGKGSKSGVQIEDPDGIACAEGKVGNHFADFGKDQPDQLSMAAVYANHGCFGAFGQAVEDQNTRCSIIDYGFIALTAAGAGTILELMAQCGDLLLCQQDSAADAAVHTVALKSGRGAGGCLGGIHNDGMVLLLCRLLFCKHYAADLTVAALGQTGGCTGRFDGRVDNDGMTQLGNCNGLTDQFHFADGADGDLIVRAFFGTGRLDAVFFHHGTFGMAQLGDGLLLQQDLLADRTHAALGQTHFRTGGGYSGQRDFGMAGGRDDLLRQMDKAADMAAGADRQAGCGTGGIDTFIKVILMSAGGRDDLLCQQDFAADLTVAALGQTGGDTGGRDGGIGSCVMAGGRMDDRITITTDIIRSFLSFVKYERQSNAPIYLKTIQICQWIAAKTITFP